MSSRKETIPVEPPLLFISYSHVTGDDECRKRLRIHLKPLVRGNVPRVFDDTELTRDVGWRQQLLAKLNEAELVLMLVSPDFLASDFCFVEEWPLARKRWKATKAIVTFALIEPCQWKETDIGQLQGVPTHGKLLPDDHRGAAHFWDDIMGKLRKDANTMNAKAAAPAMNSLRPRLQPLTNKKAKRQP
jgi:hypothetical protein